MPFPSDIKTVSLVQAARHCCVCHRYKGLKVEVHHIIQEADGGPNTLDNAITLCADCHTDAGHYNPKHPRGTKFRPDELKLARDTWHETVRRGAVPDPTHVDSLYCRYLVCKNFESISEITSDHISGFPFEPSFLVRTPVLDFLTFVVRKIGQTYRHHSQWGQNFQSEEEYVQAYPDVKKIELSSADKHQWVQYERNPTAEELRKTVGPKDYISEQMLEAELPPPAICKVRASEIGCGEVLLQEEYQLRPMWAAYLVITNESGRRLRLVGLDCLISGTEETAQFVSINATPRVTSYTIPLPSAEIPAGATIIVPIATILGPVGSASEERMWTNGGIVASGQMQEVSHGSFPSAVINDCLYWGPVLSCPQLRYMDYGLEQIQEIHHLNLENLYVLDRYWMMGSCPHLFEIDGDDAVRYLGEIFTGHSGVTQKTTISIKQGIKYLVLAELEDETTFLHTARQGNTVLAKQLCLEKGEYIVIPIESTDHVTLTGQYDLLSSPPRYAQKDFDRVRSLIRSFAGYLTETTVSGRRTTNIKHSYLTM